MTSSTSRSITTEGRCGRTRLSWWAKLFIKLIQRSTTWPRPFIWLPSAEMCAEFLQARAVDLFNTITMSYETMGIPPRAVIWPGFKLHPIEQYRDPVTGYFQASADNYIRFAESLVYVVYLLDVLMPTGRARHRGLQRVQASPHTVERGAYLSAAPLYSHTGNQRPVLRPVGRSLP